MCIMQNKSTVRPADAYQIGKTNHQKKLTTMYENDPRAPWNQVDPADVFGDAANEYIKDEVKSRSTNFIEWACDQGYLSPDYTDEDVDDIADDGAITDEYNDYRFDDVVMMLAEQAADAEDYERERYRE